MESLLTLCLIIACQKAFRFLHILEYIVAFCFICLSYAENTRRLGKINISFIFIFTSVKWDVTNDSIMHTKGFIAFIYFLKFSCSASVIILPEKKFKWLFKHNNIEIFLYSIWQNSNRSIRAHTNRRPNYRHNSRLQVTVGGLFTQDSTSGWNWL